MGAHNFKFTVCKFVCKFVCKILLKLCAQRIFAGGPKTADLRMVIHFCTVRICPPPSSPSWHLGLRRGPGSPCVPGCRCRRGSAPLPQGGGLASPTRHPPSRGGEANNCHSGMHVKDVSSNKCHISDISFMTSFGNKQCRENKSCQTNPLRMPHPIDIHSSIFRTPTHL